MNITILDIKKYVLLKDGTIKNSYFNMHSKEHRQLRDFKYYDGKLYLNYTEYKEEGAVTIIRKGTSAAPALEKWEA